MLNDPLVKIKNINQMSKHIGRDAAKSMGIPIEELKQFIKPKEIKSILKQYCVKKDEDYLLNAIILKKVFHEVNNWILGIQLSKLASSGELDACWDDEQNCMVFETKEK